MGLLDDAIREHLELKRRSGAAAEEVTRLEHEAFGPDAGKPAPAAEDAPEPPTPAEPVAEHEPEPVPEPVAAELPEPATTVMPVEPAPEPEPAPPAAAEPAPQAESEFWLDEPDEVPAEEALDHSRSSEFVAPDDEPESEDVLEETPEFLSETPEHDRLWFEQKPPRDFDFGG